MATKQKSKRTSTSAKAAETFRATAGNGNKVADKTKKGGKKTPGKKGKKSGKKGPGK